MSDIGIPPHPNSQVRQTLMFPGALPRAEPCDACRFLQGVTVGLAFSTLIYAGVGYAIYATLG